MTKFVQPTFAGWASSASKPAHCVGRHLSFVRFLQHAHRGGSTVCPRGPRPLHLRRALSGVFVVGARTRLVFFLAAGNIEGHELVLELGAGTAKRAEQDNQKTYMQPGEDDEANSQRKSLVRLSLSCPLLPASVDAGSVNSVVSVQGFDVNNVPEDEDEAKLRSSSTSSLQVEVPFCHTADQDVAEDEENGGGVDGGVRKKLRLSKDQSAFLEESFKEHSTLTPEQKSDLASRLNLRPRQVEVWFQNRRARTKLKQTEVDREYLKRCCATLTQENRRLQREVAELRALRTTYPIYSHQLAGGARRCPSCDNNNATPYSVVTAVSSSVVAAPPSMTTLFARPYSGPFTIHPVLRPHPSATS